MAQRIFAGPQTQCNNAIRNEKSKSAGKPRSGTTARWSMAPAIAIAIGIRLFGKSGADLSGLGNCFI